MPNYPVIVPLRGVQTTFAKVIAAKLPVVHVEGLIGCRVEYWAPEVTRPQLGLIQCRLLLMS
eukprot:2224501-Pyramimonas_sp.AAC.1